MRKYTVLGVAMFFLLSSKLDCTFSDRGLFYIVEKEEAPSKNALAPEASFIGVVRFPASQFVAAGKSLWRSPATEHAETPWTFLEGPKQTAEGSRFAKDKTYLDIAVHDSKLLVSAISFDGSEGVVSGIFAWDGSSWAPVSLPTEARPGGAFARYKFFPAQANGGGIFILSSYYQLSTEDSSASPKVKKVGSELYYSTENSLTPQKVEIRGLPSGAELKGAAFHPSGQYFVLADGKKLYTSLDPLLFNDSGDESDLKWWAVSLAPGLKNTQKEPLMLFSSSKNGVAKLTFWSPASLMKTQNLTDSALDFEDEENPIALFQDISPLKSNRLLVTQRTGRGARTRSYRELSWDPTSTTFSVVSRESGFTNPDNYRSQAIAGKRIQSFFLDAEKDLLFLATVGSGVLVNLSEGGSERKWVQR